MRGILLVGGMGEKTPFVRGAWPTNLWSAGDVDVRRRRRSREVDDAVGFPPVGRRGGVTPPLLCERRDGVVGPRTVRSAGPKVNQFWAGAAGASSSS